MCSEATRNLRLVRFTPLVGAQTLEGLKKLCRHTHAHIHYIHTYIVRQLQTTWKSTNVVKKVGFPTIPGHKTSQTLRMCMHTCFSSFHVFQSSMVEDMPCLTCKHIHTYIHTSLPQRSNELETKSSIDFGMYSHTYLKLCVYILLTCKSCVSLTFLVWGAQMHIVLGNLETQVVSPGFWGIVRKRT